MHPTSLSALSIAAIIAANLGLEAFVLRWAVKRVHPCEKRASLARAVAVVVGSAATALGIGLLGAGPLFALPVRLLATLTLTKVVFDLSIGATVRAALAATVVGLLGSFAVGAVLAVPTFFKIALAGGAVALAQWWLVRRRTRIAMGMR